MRPWPSLFALTALALACARVPGPPGAAAAPPAAAPRPDLRKAPTASPPAAALGWEVTPAGERAGGLAPRDGADGAAERATRGGRPLARRPAGREPAPPFPHLPAARPPPAAPPPLPGGVWGDPPPLPPAPGG